MIISEKQEISKKIDKVCKKNGKLFAIADNGELMINESDVFHAKYYVAASKLGVYYCLPNGAQNISDTQNHKLIAAFNSKQICLPHTNGSAISVRKFAEIPDEKDGKDEYVMLMYLTGMTIGLIAFSRFHNSSVTSLKMSAKAWDDIYDMLTAMLMNEDADAAREMMALKNYQAKPEISKMEEPC